MLVNFLGSETLRQRFEVSFSFRYSPTYEAGLRQRSKIDFPIHPIKFPDLDGRWAALRSGEGVIKRAVWAVIRACLVPILLTYETTVLWRLFRKIAPDILHINNGGYPGARSSRAAAIAGWLARVPNIVMVVNNMAVGYHRPTRWAGYLFDRWVTACVTTFITGSHLARWQLMSVLRLTDAQCRSIHNGIALRPIKFDKIATKERLGISDFEGIVFGVVAILRANKGHQVLLRAISKLASANSMLGSGFKVLIEGDGPLGDALKTYVKQMKLDRFCSFVGTESSIADFMGSLDVLVLPSIGQEDFPNVILEAMGMGKAVIATRIAGIPEQVVDGDTGLLVEPGNADQLADAMKKLIKDRTLATRLGNAGNKRFLENFSAAKSVSRYVELYQSLNKAESL